MLGINLAAMHEEAVRKGLLPKRQMSGTAPDLGGLVSALTSTLLGGIEGGTSTTATSPATPAESTPATASAAPTTNTPAQTSSGASPSIATETSQSSNPPAGATTPTSTAPTSTAPSTPTMSAASSTTSDVVVVGSSTINRSSLTAPTVVSSPLVAISTEPVAYVTDYTTNGQVMQTTLTSNRLHSTTTGYTAETIEPALADGGGSSGGSSGLSDNSKKIIGGVVGGVGGAIFIGALAILFYRLYARKRRHQLFSEHDDFQDSATNGSNRRSKSPFDRYRSPTPNAPVTAASNF